MQRHLRSPFEDVATRRRGSLRRRREVNELLNLFVRAQVALTELKERQEGQTLAEYGVVLGVITVLLVVVFTSLSDAIGGTINKVIGVLPK